MSATSSADKHLDHPHFYGRRHGHKLRPGRQRLIDELLPAIRVSPDDINHDILEGRLFDGTINDVWLEVGFGAGEHLAGQAQAQSNIGFIGCEPFVNGVASLLRLIEQSKIKNIKIYNDDARLLLPALPDKSIGRVFVLFSDPWPKKRHHRRRFLNRDTLDQLARLMKDDAELRFASDHSGYIRWALELINHHPDFTWPVQSPADWREPPADWVPTRYETKAKHQKIACTYLRFLRHSR